MKSKDWSSRIRINIKFMYIFLEIFSSRPTLSPLSTALNFLLLSVFFLFDLNLRHVDLYYEDGSNPPESVLQVISTDTGITHHGYEYYFIKGLKKVKSSEEGERQEIFSLSLSRMLYTWYFSLFNFLSLCVSLTFFFFSFLHLSNFFKFVRQRKELLLSTARRDWDEPELILPLTW